LSLLAVSLPYSRLPDSSVDAECGEIHSCRKLAEGLPGDVAEGWAMSDDVSTVDVTSLAEL